MKIVINSCFGGFSLSREAMIRYGELSGVPIYLYEYDIGCNNRIHRCDGNVAMFMVYFTKPDLTVWDTESYKSNIDLDRTDPILIRVVEELGTVADGLCARLKVIEIPDDVDWEISAYDGLETVEEKHRRWG